jgi:hypothetical protein
MPHTGFVVHTAITPQGIQNPGQPPGERPHRHPLAFVDIDANMSHGWSPVCGTDRVNPVWSFMLPRHGDQPLQLIYPPPLIWKHINLTGDYVWNYDHVIAREFHPLRLSPQY